MSIFSRFRPNLGNLLLRTKNNPLKRVCLDIRRHSIDTWRAWWTHRSLNLRFPPAIPFPTRVRPPTGSATASAQFAIGAWTVRFLFDMTVGVSDKRTLFHSMRLIFYRFLLRSFAGTDSNPVGTSIFGRHATQRKSFPQRSGSLSRLFPFPSYRVDKDLLR